MMDSQEITDAAIARLRGDRKVLFVAVSTGQGLANLSPILEVARPGDEVLWLESERAARKQYTAGPREVLLQRQIHSRDPVRISDSPREIAETLRASLAWEASAKPVLVQNGGTKLTGLGLDHGADHAMPVLYGEVDPAHLVVFPEGVMGPELRRPYQIADLGLDEMLICSGFRITNPTDNPRVKFWPGASGLAEQNYGIDAEESAQAHRRAHVISRWSKIDEGDSPQYKDYVLLDDLLYFKPNRLKGWVTSINGNKNRLSGGVDMTNDRDILGPIFNGAVKAAAQVANQIKMTDAPPGVKLGPLFELAVARRTQAWLEEYGSAHGVLEAWTNVIVRGPTSPNDDAQWDVVLVLRGGIVIHLECKSFAIDDKDLDARLLNLVTAAGQMAKMYICSPVYTQFEREEWFQETLTKSDRLREAVNGNWIGFGLPGQTPKYTRPAKGGGFAQQRCEPFEERLSEILR